MIRNIVFDMGNVLIRFDPETFMDQEGITDPADRKLVLNELFKTTEWALMDLGILTEETAEPAILERFPDSLRDSVRHLLHHWWEKRECVPGMEEVLSELKGEGYGIYLLSNASVSQHLYWPGFAMSKLFDGKLISCDVKIVKPDPGIYRLFTERFRLKPEECLFVDDLPANVAGAVSCGWQGIVFHGSAGELRTKMREMGVRIREEH